MLDPPPELNERFDKAPEKARVELGKTYGRCIDGNHLTAAKPVDDRSPINTDWLLGRIAEAAAEHVALIVKAANSAFRNWWSLPKFDRTWILRRVGRIIEERVYDISATAAFDVGKNRMQAIGGVWETADFLHCYCDDFAHETVRRLGGYRAVRASGAGPRQAAVLICKIAVFRARG